MFPIALAGVDRFVFVGDDGIRGAQRVLWERVAAEPGGAAAFSASLLRKYQPEPGERVGVLVCV